MLHFGNKIAFPVPVCAVTGLVRNSSETHIPYQW